MGNIESNQTNKQTKIHLITFQVDCSIYEHLCEDYMIEQYPTLKWFKDGELVGLSTLVI